MWIFTDFGFFSITRSRDERDKMQIRARSRRDIENAVNRLPNIHGERVKIIETPGADYRFRIIVTPAMAGHFIGQTIAQIPYFNFKGRCQETDQRDKLGILHDVWAKMFAYQGDNTPPSRERDPMEEITDWGGGPVEQVKEPKRKRPAKSAQRRPFLPGPPETPAQVLDRVMKGPRNRKRLDVIDDRTAAQKAADGDLVQRCGNCAAPRSAANVQAFGWKCDACGFENP